MVFNLNSQENEKFELFSQWTYDLKNLGNVTLFITLYNVYSVHRWMFSTSVGYHEYIGGILVFVG